MVKEPVTVSQTWEFCDESLQTHYLAEWEHLHDQPDHLLKIKIFIKTVTSARNHAI